MKAARIVAAVALILSSMPSCAERNGSVRRGMSNR